jgi:hypothetical protein
MQNTLTPRTEIDSTGKIAYSESCQAWNILQLKKELFSEFPQLKEKRSKFGYKLVFCRDPKSFEKQISNIKKQKILPILVWLYKEN